MAVTRGQEVCVLGTERGANCHNAALGYRCLPSEGLEKATIRALSGDMQTHVEPAHARGREQAFPQGRSGWAAGCLRLWEETPRRLPWLEKQARRLAL